MSWCPKVNPAFPLIDAPASNVASNTKIVPLAFIGGVFVIEIGSSLIQILGKKYLHRKLLPIAPIHLYFLKKGWEEPKIVMRAWIIGLLFAVIGLFIAFSG